MATRLKALREFQRVLGFSSGIKWYLLRSQGVARATGVVVGKIHPKSARYPLVVRLKDNSSDVPAFQQIFVEEELAALATLNSLRPRVVMDLGANVGYASAYFLNAFPEAFVLAVEPDPENAEMCRRNLAPYGERAKVVEGAVWPVGGKIALSRGTFGDGRSWATEVREAVPGELADVTAWNLPSLISLCPQPEIDILKIDIEGSERALFAGQACGWLEQVRNMCIEVHGPECQDAVAEALGGYEYETAQAGEYQIFRGLRRRLV